MVDWEGKPVFCLSALIKINRFFAYCRYELNKVNVAFDNRDNLSTKDEDNFNSKEPGDSAKPEHAYSPADRHRGLNYSTQITPCSACAEDDVRSIRSHCETAPGATTRSNILSQMAKTKTSWVEDQNSKLDSFTSRKSPILCKGKPLGSSSCTPYQENQLFSDNSTKGIRDGRRFDLLPISKNCSQSLKERRFYKEKRVPLVRICSYQKMCFQMPCTSLRHDEISRSSCSATFFTKKDVFKPFQARAEPTIGEKLFVQDSSSVGKFPTCFPSHAQLSNRSSSAKFKLPNLRREQDRAVHSQGNSSGFRAVYRTRVAFPVIA